MSTTHEDSCANNARGHVRGACKARQELESVDLYVLRVTETSISFSPPRPKPLRRQPRVQSLESFTHRISCCSLCVAFV